MEKDIQAEIDAIYATITHEKIVKALAGDDTFFIAKQYAEIKRLQEELDKK